MYVEKKTDSAFIDNKLSQNVTDLLAESEKAIREGNSKLAHELSVQATQAEPQSIDAWLLRATLAPSVEERIYCVNRITELAPGYRDRYNLAFFALKEFLDKNPYLAYLEETDELYRTTTADHLVLSIPKKRVPVEPYPPDGSERRPLRSAYRWLALAIAGLLIAGFGAIIFAPLAAFSAISAEKTLETHAERVSLAIVVIVAFVLFFVGTVFSVLFVLHLIG